MDVTAYPELLRAAEEVGKSGEARLLCRDGEDLAVLMPISRARRSPGRKRTKKDLEAFRSASGGWADMDVESFVEANYASRRASTRPPVEL